MLTANEIIGIDAERFWSKVDKPSAESCWNWKGASRGDGYGVVRASGKLLKVHRVAYCLWNDRPIPADLVIDHLCFNKGCCNPLHLEDILQSENVRRYHQTIDPDVKCWQGHRHVRGKGCRECNRLNQEKWRTRNKERSLEQSRKSYYKRKAEKRAVVVH